MVSRDTVVQRRSDLVAADLDGEVTMMSIESGRYYRLNGVGSQVWEELAEPRRVQDLIDVLLTGYDVERETCAREVLGFLETLSERRLIEEVTP